MSQGIDTSAADPRRAEGRRPRLVHLQRGHRPPGRAGGRGKPAHGDATRLVSECVGLPRPTDPVADEKFAILLYHAVTDQTGDPATEWPPTDCGSTGLYVCNELERQGLIVGHLTATAGAGLLVAAPGRLGNPGHAVLLLVDGA